MQQFYIEYDQNGNACVRPVPDRPPVRKKKPSKAAREAKRRKEKKRKRARLLRALLLMFGLVLLVYLGLCWMPWQQLAPDSPLDLFQSFMIRNSRESHSYLWVQYFFPDYVRQPYIRADIEARAAQENFNTRLDPAAIVLTAPADGQPMISDRITDRIQEEIVPTLSQDQLAFYERFYQLDFDSAEAYFRQHPDLIWGGYDKIQLDRAGLDQQGTEIYTTSGEQVLAIDAVNGILLVRVEGENYRGVLAIAKDPRRLQLCTSRGLQPDPTEGGYGQTVGDIAQEHGGVLAISASGFLDENGVGNGGGLVGFCRSGGQDYGEHRYWGSKRLELRKSGWLYITEAQSDCRSDVTDAMEFEPALIVDGQRLESYVYTADNPRACVGQTDKGEILMLAIEGRLSDSAGCSVGECTSILQRYRCINAMNMDGGTSAMLWYNGRPVLRCSNQTTPEGRFLPNAWVYRKSDE